MKKLPIHIKILIGLIFGVIYAFLSSYLGWNDFTIKWIDPFGTIFIRLLKFIAVPLVLFSIIGGVANLSDVSKLGRLGGKTLGAYMATTFMAIGVALIIIAIFGIYNSLSISSTTVLISSVALGIFFLILSAVVSR